MSWEERKDDVMGRKERKDVVGMEIVDIWKLLISILQSVQTFWGG